MQEDVQTPQGENDEQGQNEGTPTEGTDQTTAGDDQAGDEDKEEEEENKAQTW